MITRTNLSLAVLIDIRYASYYSIGRCHRHHAKDEQERYKNR